MKCTNCGNELAVGVKFCPECGTPVPKNKFCSVCGAKLEPGVKFCPECGTKVDGASTASSAPVSKTVIDYDSLDSLSLEELLELEAKTNDDRVQEAIAENYEATFSESLDASDEVRSKVDFKALEENITKWYLKAAENGNSKAMVELAEIYDGDDDEQAFYWFKKGVEAGNEDGLEKLGNHYREGRGVEQDIEKAVECYRKAGNDSLITLGKMYLYGEDGLEEDNEEAFKYFKSAVNSGVEEGYLWIGKCLYFGWGVEEDVDQAINMLKKVSVYNDAQHFLGRCYEQKEDYITAIEWWEKAAEGNNSDSLRELGICYYNANGVQRDFNKAFQYFKRAGEDAYDMHFWLGTCYFTGRGTEQDYEEAFRLFQLGADDDEDKYCQEKLGDCYAKGLGTTKDIEKAKEYYQKAADQGKESAKEKLQSL